jgi:hypothetical protein
VALSAAGAHDASLIRLIAAMRQVDSILYIGDDVTIIENLLRRDDDFFRPIGRRGNVWLRLPCRTITGRIDAFTEVHRVMGLLAGPTLNCPAFGKTSAQLERLVGTPGKFERKFPQQRDRPDAPKVPRPKRSTAWDRATAVAYMGLNPGKAEPVLRAAAKTDARGMFELILFLHAFTDPSTARNQEIDGLIAGLPDAIVRDAAHPWDPAIFRSALGRSMNPENPDASTHYDGSDTAIFALLYAMSLQNDIDNVIPCDVLLRRPKLLDALEPMHGSGRDNFISRAGCGAEHQKLKEFPEARLRAFIAKSTRADGQFISNYFGSARATHSKANEWVFFQAMIDPITLIAPESYYRFDVARMDYPYQTWGLLGPSNYDIADDLRLRYQVLLKQLTRYNRKRGLDQQQAGQAAKIVLFRLAYGSNCGQAAPGDSVRRLMLERASVAKVRSFWLEHGVADSPEVLECARHGGLEPLIHVAAARGVEMLKLSAAQGLDIHEPNAFGKTPLMTAVQFDDGAAVRWLLDQGAAIEARTQSPESALAHDQRTPLMYAAATASASTIDLLLARGADPFRADSKGRRAIDYLLGFGPVPPNPRIRDHDRRRLAAVLF